MIKILVGLSVFIAGGVVGGYGYYIAIHSKVDYSSDASALISQILLHSNQEIADGNYRCESGGNQNAREVLSSIIGGGLAYTVNPLSAGCANGAYSVVLNHCRPWQNSECGSRVLVFNKAPSGNIVPSSFKCLDIP